MKNRISTLIATLAVATCAQAQWTPDDKAYSIVGQDSIYGQAQMKVQRTADGKTVLTWLNTPKGLRYDNPDFGYYLYMQTFDADGKPMLGKNGKIISRKPTKSYTTDYGMQLTADGNIVISYTDTRNDADKQRGDNYLYCYTPEGEPVWDKEGVKIVSETSRPNYEDIVPTLCVSGSNTYGQILHIERFRVKADETDWEPSPWDPDEEMPDSIDKEESECQIMRYASDGAWAWNAPLRIASSDAWTYPAPDGGLYIIYINKGYGIDARRIDSNGNDVWTEPVNVESGTVTNGSFTDEPTVVADGKGGLMLVYRKLLAYSGYMVANHLTPDGTVYDDEFIVNGTQDGDSNNPVAAVNGNRMFTAFSYTYGSNEHDLWINQLDIDGDYTWEGDNLLGYSLDENEQWGMKAVKAIPQTDGWVLLYGNAQSWNGADFYVAKIDFDGNTVWQKQIAEDDFKSSGFAITNDDRNAYIFYTCDMEIGDDWEEIPGEGGMRVMCVDITGNATGINAVGDKTNTAKAIYTADGMRVESMSQPGLYIVKDGNATKKIVKK